MDSLIFITKDFEQIYLMEKIFKSYGLKIRESIDILAILHFYEKSTSRWYEA